MSSWTHVNAHFRFNVFKVEGSDYNNVEEVKKFLGPRLSFKDIMTNDKVRDYFKVETNLPTGSEGSLSYHVYFDEVGDKMNISFYGDLRDFSSEEVIIDYFTKLLNSKGLYVSLRAGVVQIETSYMEGGSVYICEEDENADEEIEFKFRKCN